MLNFRKCYQIWGKLAQERKITGKKQNSGWKPPPPPPSPVLTMLSTLPFYKELQLINYQDLTQDTLFI